MPERERIEGPFPDRRVAYATVDYVLDDWTPCDKEEATTAIIREYDAQDRMLQETVGSFTARTT